MRKRNTEEFLIAFHRLLFLLGLKACMSGSRLCACLAWFPQSCVAAEVGHGFAQWVTRKDSVSQQGSSRWREQAVARCTAAASPVPLSLGLWHGTTVQHQRWQCCCACWEVSSPHSVWSNWDWGAFLLLFVCASEELSPAQDELIVR